MRKKQFQSTLYQYYIIVVLLAAIAISGGRDFLFQKKAVEVQIGLPEIQEIFPAATQYSLNRFGIYEVFGAAEQRLGTALLSSNYSQQYGYAGIVPLLIGVDADLVITQLIVLPNNETGDYVEAVYSPKFIGLWEGVSLEEALQLQVDAVSGATHTSRAVIAGVRQTASHILETDTDALESNLWTSIKDLLFLALVALSILMAYKKGRAKYRTVYLIGVLLIMGLVVNNLLSARLLHGWLLQGFVWSANWQSMLLFFLALSLSFLGKRKFYCNYLCPMGALQELTNKISPFKKRKMPGPFWGISIREIYLTLIAAALLMGFTPELAYLEPFVLFSFRIVGWGIILFGAAIVVLSLFYNQPWCALCPTGCFLDTLSYNKIKAIDSKHTDHAKK